jgi:hypothetical protein
LIINARVERASVLQSTNSCNAGCKEKDMVELSLKGSRYIFSKVLFDVIDSLSCATNNVSLSRMTSTSMDMALAEAASQKGICRK